MPENKSIVIAFYIFAAITILFTLSVSGSYGQMESNVTTTCNNGNCTTTICVNNEPCKITNSNSTNITNFGDLLRNKTIPMPPEEVV